ncbi:MAG: ATP-binding protein [Nocardioidaceae bacterium]
MSLGIQLPPEPQSAPVARRWVRQRLTEIGRAELVAAAETGVSELVTNGILHARTTIGLLLDGEAPRPWTGDNRLSDEAMRAGDLTTRWTASSPERSGADA